MMMPQVTAMQPTPIMMAGQVMMAQTMGQMVGQQVRTVN
jgi:hypothetical protein